MWKWLSFGTARDLEQGYPQHFVTSSYDSLVTVLDKWVNRYSLLLLSKSGTTYMKRNGKEFDLFTRVVN